MTFRTLGDVLRRNATERPEVMAFVFGDVRVTFADHLARAETLARALAAAGVGPQDRVAVMSRNSLEFMEIYGGAELSSYIVATVNFRLAVPEVQRVISVSKPKIFFFQTAFTPVVQPLTKLGMDIIFVAIGDAVPDWAVAYEDFLARGDRGGALQAPGPDDIVHLIFTSGSTGQPKGVMRSHRTELAVCEYFSREIDIRADDRMLLMMPVFHVGHRFMQLGAHLAGIPVHVQAEFDPRLILETIERERITITHMAPTMVRALLELPDIETYDLSSLRTLVYSGAPMPVPQLERGLQVLGSVFLQLYGMSEASATTLHRHEHDTTTLAGRERLKSVGKPSHGVEIRIADGSDRVLCGGEIGEIQLRAPTVMRGYWDDTDATAKALRGGWYHTGDMGRIDGGGYVYLVDRAKDMIISGGENIYSREVEEALASHPSVDDVAVIGMPDSYWGEAVVAVVVSFDGSVTADQLIAHCRTRIASYKKPRLVRFVSELPRLPSGKTDKVALRTLMASRDAG